MKTTKTPEYSPAVFSAHYFGFFNAISFTIILGTPLFLYAKHIGASSTVLGVIASLTPILTILQVPAAYFLGRFGYKKFILYGWTTRTVFIFFVASLPLLTFMDNTTRLVLLIMFMFAFNFFRGIATCAWMPWISQIVPGNSRGIFFSREVFTSNLGSMAAFLCAALILSGDAKGWEYSLLFFLSGIAGLICVPFIKKMPDMGSSESLNKSSHPVPWLAMLRYQPFREYLSYSLVVTLFLGSLGVFSVEYLREVVGMRVDKIMLVTAPVCIGALLFMPLLGKFSDNFGSKPMLCFSLLLFAFIIFLWATISGGILANHWIYIAIISLLSGLATAAYNVANSRLGTIIIPEMGRNHFFALFAVITCLSQGASPVLGGIILDAIGASEFVTGSFTWKRHSILFIGLLLICLTSLFILIRSRALNEKNISTTVPISTKPPE